MSYKRMFLGFGILNSILLIFIIYSFLHNHEGFNLREKLHLSKANNSQEKIALASSDDADPLEKKYLRVKSIIFLLASSLSLVPFLLFFTVIVKKFKKYKRRQNELIHVNKNKDLFFSIISHDLKTPAQNLISLSELNYKNLNTPQESAKINQLIYSCSLKHYELLTNLLDWSRTQFTGNHHIKTSCCIKQLIDENIGSHSEKIKEKGLQVTNLIEGDFCISTNENMLNTVIRNILNNAIKFTSAPGKIVFYAKSNKKNIQIYIEDTGAGMSLQTLNNLFNINYIRSLRGTNKEVGTGIGLIICKEILTKLNGEIKVISSENHGSIFILNLPSK